MTNAELLAKIKAEIEKLIERYGSVKAKGTLQEGYKGGRLIGYKDVLNILKRIQEESEKPIIPDLEKELARFYLKDLCGSEKDEIPEATLHHNFPIMWDDLRDLARHFAQWGAEHANK